MSYSQLNDIMLKLTDKTTVKVLNVLLDRKEIIDEEMVNILNEEIEQSHEASGGDETQEIPRIALKEVRKSLYKLNERSLARYRRVRDRETGYFVYYWSPIYERILDLIISRRKQSIKKLRQRLDYEQRNLLYVCDEGHTPVPFSDAFELGFICTTCSKELSQKDNTKTIQFLEKKIEELDSELKNGLEELDDIAELFEKQSLKK
ncbi:MAG: transcription factor [Candidatus Heimdallarchaeota archaeon]|nr:MAG: transcription factor [Candidatus Heimdallarchaeota archaeon]